jgi:hypothetical protein
MNSRRRSRRMRMSRRIRRKKATTSLSVPTEISLVREMIPTTRATATMTRVALVLSGV